MNLKELLKSKIFNGRKEEYEPENIGEKIACKFLKQLKYKIIDKNFRSRFGEIDIISEDSKTICFVEVKSRSRTDYGLPEEFVDKRKQEKLLKTAQTYVSKNNLEDINMRFDIVSVNLVNSECRIIKNAFEI